MSSFEIKMAANGWQYYFVLKASNGEVIATSEMYNSKPAARDGIQSVKTWAPIAAVEDRSNTVSGRWF